MELCAGEVVVPAGTSQEGFFHGFSVSVAAPEFWAWMSTEQCMDSMAALGSGPPTPVYPQTTGTDRIGVV